MTTKLCTVANCNKKLASCGFCHMHYSRFKKYGTTDTPPGNPKVNDICHIANCTNKAKTRQLCDNHYHKLRYNGKLPNIWVKYASYCTVEGCNTKHASEGFCRLHYRRQRKYGKKEVPEHEYSDNRRNQRYYRKLAI